MNRNIVVGLAVLLLLLLSGGFFSANYYSVVADVRENFIDIDTTDTYVHGETLFQTRGCAACHTLDVADATGDAGPSLNSIGSRADSAYIRTSIVDPNAIIATDCPEGPCEPDDMPAFGQILDDEQVDALVTYLSAQK